MVSGQSFGSSTVSLACLTVQGFPGSHSLRLAFGSFFYHLILAVLLFAQAVSFFIVFSYAWLLCNHCFPRNFGRQSWRDIPLRVWPWFLFGVSKVPKVEAPGHPPPLSDAVVNGY